MTNKYLEKIAKTKEYNSSMAKLTTAVGVTAGIAGGKMLHHEYNSGNLTGRETLYHGSSDEAISKIHKQGLRPNQPGRQVSDEVAGLRPLNKDHVFATKVKEHAKMYAAQQRNINDGIKFDKDLISNAKKTTKKGIAHINLPTWKKPLKNAGNPEYDLWLKRPDRKLITLIYPNMDKTMKTQLVDTVHVVKRKTGIPSAYIKGSDKYKPNSIKEIKNFVKSNPKRFLKGTGKAGLGLALAAGGSALLYNTVKKINSKS